MKGIQHSRTTKRSDVCSQQVLPHQKYRKNDSCARDGVRAGRGSPCAVLLPLSIATSAPHPTRSALSQVLSLPLPFSRFPFSPVPKNKSFSQLLVLI